MNNVKMPVTVRIESSDILKYSIEVCYTNVISVHEYTTTFNLHSMLGLRVFDIRYMLSL